MTERAHDLGDSAGFVRLQPREPPAEQIGFGMVGIVLFALFGGIAYAASRELVGVSAYMALGASIVFFLLSAAALYGTVHVSLSTRVAAPILEIESLELTRGRPAAVRLSLKGPASLNELRVSLVCTQTEYEEATRETRRSFENSGPYETEAVSLDRGETELDRIDVFTVPGLHAADGENVVQNFTIEVPEEAVPSGSTQVSEFVCHSYDWKIIVEGDIFGPNSQQEYDVVVL